jgi:endonuclease/exonuclease/phosphatase family metal-dependent hydrolase
MEAGVVGFQEVFHEGALRDAVEKSSYLRGAEILLGEQNGSAPRVALATTYPVVDVKSYMLFPETLHIEGLEVPVSDFSRPVLEVTVKVLNKLEITFFVVHLKSKRPMIEEGADGKDPMERARGQARSLIRRAAESVALRSILMQKLAKRDHPVVVLGDVNDSGGAVTTRIISGEVPHRRFPREVREKLWDILLYHAQDIQARRSYNDYYFSHIHNGHYEGLDHIMVSQELVADNPAHIGRIGLVRTFNDHLVDGTLSEEDVPLWQSDHGQVVASIELKRQ